VVLAVPEFPLSKVYATIVSRENGMQQVVADAWSLHQSDIVSDIAVFVLKRDVKLQQTNQPTLK